MSRVTQKGRNIMAITISICSEKGGVGKTTTTLNLAGGLACLGKKVLVVDLDQQQNTSYALGFIKDGNPTIAELIYNTTAKFEINHSAAIRHNENGIDYIPASDMLTNITSMMSNDPDYNYVIKKILSDDIYKKYDYILIDCRTLLDLLVSNAMNASDYVIIPVESGVYAYNGLDKMLDKVSSISNSTNKKLKVLGILLNKMTRTNVSTSLSQSIREEYGNLTFKTEIPSCPAQTERAVINQKANVFDKSSSIGKHFLEFTKEVIKKTK